MKRPLKAILGASVLVGNSDALATIPSRATFQSSPNTAPSSAAERSRSSQKQEKQSVTLKIPSVVTDDKTTEDLDERDFEFEVNSFQELQRSTGTEILDSQLQTQIDQATDYPNLFLDAHVSDASYMEKVAMANIPEQLPRPAIDALRKAKGLNYSGIRVTREEEVELGKMIQRGVKLHGLRAEFEESNGRKPTRSEWAQVAGLESVRHLRREVADYRRAKQLLVSANIGLVHAVVKSRYSSFKRSGLTFDEIVQEGSLGLLRAAELFDPNRGLRFSTYATIWIKGQLSNSNVHESIKLPQREKTKWNKIVKAKKELLDQNGDSGEPTVEELANHLGMTVAEVVGASRKMSQVSQVLSLDYEYSTQSRSGMESASMNKLESDKNFIADADLAERTQLHADIVAAMARNLDAREARLMRLRYGLADGSQRSLSQCAEAMGISKTYAQKIASSCLKKLREASEVESLEEYLLTIA